MFTYVPVYFTHERSNIKTEEPTDSTNYIIQKVWLVCNWKTLALSALFYCWCADHNKGLVWPALTIRHSYFKRSANMILQHTSQEETWITVQAKQDKYIRRSKRLLGKLTENMPGQRKCWMQMINTFCLEWDLFLCSSTATSVGQVMLQACLIRRRMCNTRCTTTTFSIKNKWLPSLGIVCTCVSSSKAAVNILLGCYKWRLNGPRQHSLLAVFFF